MLWPSARREVQAGQVQLRLKPRPVKPGARVRFAAWRNVLVAGHVSDAVALHEGSPELREGLILSGFEGVIFQAFKFHANRVVVAAAATPIAGRARMPGALFAVYKLQQSA